MDEFFNKYFRNFTSIFFLASLSVIVKIILDNSTLYIVRSLIYVCMYSRISFAVSIRFLTFALAFYLLSALVL